MTILKTSTVYATITAMNANKDAVAVTASQAVIIAQDIVDADNPAEYGQEWFSVQRRSLIALEPKSEDYKAEKTAFDRVRAAVSANLKRAHKMWPSWPAVNGGKNGVEAFELVTVAEHRAAEKESKAVAELERAEARVERAENAQRGELGRIAELDLHQLTAELTAIINASQFDLTLVAAELVNQATKADGKLG